MKNRLSFPDFLARLTGRRQPPPETKPPEQLPPSVPLATLAQERQEAMQRAEQEQEWKKAARSAIELCNVWLVMGHWSQVLATVEQSKTWLERQDDPLTRLYLHTRLATALHRLGALQESRIAFQEAERWQTDRQTDYHWLIGMPGKGYCDLLLDQARDASGWEMVLHRSHYSQKVVKNLFAIALDLQTQGRALAALGQPETARVTFEQAVIALRKANRRSFLPDLLLHQAGFLRQQGEPHAARPLLAEAFRIAEEEDLQPAIADGRLLEGHLLLDSGEVSKAETALLDAETRIAGLSYGQRLAETHILRARLLQQQGRQAEANHWKETARQRLEEHNQWGVLPIWQRETADG